MRSQPVIDIPVERKPKPKSYRKSYGLKILIKHDNRIVDKWSLNPTMKPRIKLLVNSEMLLDSI